MTNSLYRLADENRLPSFSCVVSPLAWSITTMPSMPFVLAGKASTTGWSDWRCRDRVGGGLRDGRIRANR
jgi:hypothetical protein